MTSMHDQRFSNTLELAVRFGKTLIIQVGARRGRGLICMEISIQIWCAVTPWRLPFDFPDL
jgi:hypothetical protein